MSAEKAKRPKSKSVKQTTFHCKICGKEEPIEEMRVLNAFFPPLIACKNCEVALR